MFTRQFWVGDRVILSEERKNRFQRSPVSRNDSGGKGKKNLCWGPNVVGGTEQGTDLGEEKLEGEGGDHGVENVTSDSNNTRRMRADVNRRGRGKKINEKKGKKVKKKTSCSKN